MDTQRLSTLTNIILHGHILNWFWKSKADRRRYRGEVTQKAVLKYLQKYVPYIQSIPEDSPEENSLPEKEKIFTIWLQGEESAPEIVKACFRSIRRMCSQELVILDEKTLGDWIELPGHVMDKWKAGNIRPAHFTDICRTELLYRHGGVWMDATDFAVAPIPDQVMNEDFFIFLSGETMSGAYAFIQNCFFRAKKENYLIKAWNLAIQNYWKYEDSTVDYFVHQLLFKLVTDHNPKAAALFARMPKISQEATHALWWNYRDRPFSQEVFTRVTEGSFFQKTEYKSKSASSPIPGSFSDIMQKMP